MTQLIVQGLNKAFGGPRVVDAVAFGMADGQMVAMIGPNGAGKTTCFNLLGGQLRADSGSVRLDGAELLGRPPRRVARLGIGRTFQIPATFASMTVVENVQVALLAARRRLLHGLWPAARFYRDDALALLGRVGLRDAANRPSAELAYGDLKRLELAVALAGKPRLLLMDEPAAGMAPAERRELMTLVRRLTRHPPYLGVLFTEHDMDVVFRHADRVIVLDHGRVIADAAPAAVRADALVQAVYLGRAR